MNYFVCFAVARKPAVDYWNMFAISKWLDMFE
jgi:hypothetical protein